MQGKERYLKALGTLGEVLLELVFPAREHLHLGLHHGLQTQHTHTAKTTPEPHHTSLLHTCQTHR